MSAQTPRNLRECTELLETAMHCYLSTILSAADSLAEMCPDVGVPYQYRWRRLPQRLGFDISPQALEASGRMFESDLENFARLAGRYYSKGLPLIKAVGGEGSRTAAAVLQAASSHAGLLETMAESIDAAADLESPEELRELLETQADGLRRCAEQVKARLLPPAERLAQLMAQCVQLQKQTESDATLDADTGFVNPWGFRYEIENHFRDRQRCCVLIVDCAATSFDGGVCQDRDFNAVVGEIASRVAEQFRPADSLGRISTRRFAVIFDGEPESAKGRLEQIARSIGGWYAGASGPISVTVEIQLLEAESPASILAVLFPHSEDVPAGKAAAD